MYGRQFLREEFGVENELLWLPDVFGYSGALPQILKKSGIEKFFTAKLFWNEINKPPHNMFIWKGIDGSEVFAQLSDTYVKSLDPHDVMNAWRLHKDKRYSDTHVMTFGYGDGGGGPTAWMLENYRRMKGGLPGFPKLKMQRAKLTLEESERNFRRSCEQLRFTPKWIGELYFECHRGTYTTQAANKKNNRRAELKMASAEALAVIDKQLLGTEYPAEALHGAWIKLLRNQFHDIIPGSSIGEVYRDSALEYEEIFEQIGGVSDASLGRICSAVGTKGGLFVYNPAPFELDGVIDTPDGARYVEGIPAHGYKVVDPVRRETVRAADGVIENELIRVELDEAGEIRSILDKRVARELVAEGERCNVLEIYEDIPHKYDAWEIQEYYSQKRWTLGAPVSTEYVNEGERAGVRLTRRYGASEFVQTVMLSHGSARLDFVTEVDWHESHQLLKAAFNTNIRTAAATYEIQFGHLDRPTHRNTSVDRAKYEVCAHKWADLSEHSYGFSLLNDSKYGYSCDEGKLSISLLRSPKWPDPNADMGKHKFTYSVLPHVGSVGESTVREGYFLNCAPTAIPLGEQVGALPEVLCPVVSEAAGFVVETLKQAEDGNGYILRGYEALGDTESVSLRLGLPAASAELCDLMEKSIAPIAIEDGRISFTAKPFEIVSVRIRS